MSARLARRQFLQHSALGALTATTLQPAAAQPTRSASRTLVVALIGCGGRGTHDMSRLKANPNVELAYVCDVDESRRLEAAKNLGVEARCAVGDMRRVFDDPAVDAVIVATPDHWHSPASILACQAGKHVYVEKPISHNIREGRLLVEAAARHKVQVQHGIQSRSTQMMIDAVKLLREGIIGKVTVAKCWNIQRRGPLPPGQDTDPPAGLDYDNWIGPVTMIPYRTNRVHKRWTMWHHFGVGEMGNDGVHDLDYARWGLGVETHPTSVAAIGGKFVLNDETEFPDTQQVTFEYPGDDSSAAKRMLIYEQRLWSTNYPHNCDSGAEFYGTAGQMFLSRRGKIQVLADRNQPIEVNVKPGPQDDAAHLQNFCAAIREGAKLNGDALTGHLTTSLCHLGNIATRLRRHLQFDPQTEQFVNDRDANALVRREYRDHWGRPSDA
ncbi:MAG: Gfo/Idh/MocA family oxidoreductase [Planctomycetaceae bacterium]|nr:Gfo/Idh/MocA family oxidoreductase [Planctomycetaceae bacterium]